MAENDLDPMIDDELPDTPEDVAILYSWANIHGAKYRDFSASRREYRAQMRARAMEAQREAELRAAQEREEAAREQEEAARRASSGDSSSRRAAIEHEEAAMRAEVERLEAQRHAEAAELARQAAEEAEREAEDARRRAREQALRYAESDQRRRAFAGPQPTDVPGKIDDPYHFAGHVDPSRLGQSGVRSSGFTKSRGGSSASVRAVRPDSLPNPARLIRDEVPDGRMGSSSELSAYGSDGRYDLEREAEARQRRYENRLFRDPLDPRFQSSSAARQAYRPAARSTDPDFIPPRHEDVREGVDRAVFERIGSQELSHLQDEAHRVEEFNRAHRRGQHGPGHHIDPTVEQFTEPRPLLESKARERAREDAAARHHLHEEVERELRHDQSSSGHRDASAEISRLRHQTHHDREAAEAWEREHAEAEAKRKRERDQREEVRIKSESVQREAFRRPVGDRYQETRAQRESREFRAREVVERDQREQVDREAKERQRREAVDQAAREGRERAEREQRDRESREIEARERAERDAREREAVERAAMEREEREREIRDRETRERAERAARESVERARAEEARAAKANADSRERETARRDRSREIRESMMSSAMRPVAGASGIRPVSGATAVRVGGASAIRPAAGYSAIRPAAIPYGGEAESSRPSWLDRDASAASVTAASAVVPVASSMNDTLQQSRERVAARWFALKELLGQSSGEHAKAQAAPQNQRETRTPTLCVISMAGGVGRTSMVATLGRTLSSMGEKVLLADTGSHGLLPYYFGARDLRPGVVRTFSPPVGSPDAAVYMVNFDTDSANYDPAGQDHIYSELQHATRGIHRVMLDLQMPSAWLVRRLAKSSPVVLVPLAPDMNSVLGIQSVERILGGLTSADGSLIQPYYVLNQFDASQPLHLDVREALRQKLGERLLPIVIRRSPAVAEALAEGMTVMDYAPGSAVTEDYSQLASWIRNMTAPATSNYRGMRWSEG